MKVARRLQIQQFNDWEILEFFNVHGVEFALVGDHRFMIRSRETDVAAGPGDWLSVAADGEVEVERVADPRRAPQPAAGAGNPSAERSELTPAVV